MVRREKPTGQKEREKREERKKERLTGKEREKREERKKAGGRQREIDRERERERFALVSYRSLPANARPWNPK